MNRLLFLLIAAIFLCGSCVTAKDYMNRDKLASLKIGMNKQKVIELLDKPHYLNIEKNYEIWKYKYLEFFGGYSFIEIKFVNDVIESIDSYFIPEHSLVPANKKHKESSSDN